MKKSDIAADRVKIQTDQTVYSCMYTPPTPSMYGHASHPKYVWTHMDTPPMYGKASYPTYLIREQTKPPLIGKQPALNGKTTYNLF